MTLFPQLLSDMGMLVLECKPGPVFVALNRIPDWFVQMHSAPLPAEGVLDIAALFPFVEHFLEDADVYWRQPEAPRLSSGVWTEMDEQGLQHQLEAYALRYLDRRLLLLVDLTASFDTRHQVYQRAREIALEQERLVMSLQRQQRKLQMQLQGLLSRDESLAGATEHIRQHASAVMVCRPDGSVELLNQALTDIYPATGSGSARAEPSLLQQWMREAETLYPEIHRVIDAGASWEGEFESNAGDNKKWVRLLVGPVLDDQQRVTHLVCVANDISSLRQPAIELERVTDYDFTTQLPNRRHFWRVLTRAIDECRASGETLVLLYLDVDHFKRINDSLDHQAGDLLLGTLSSRLQRNIKKTDFIAHLGGDEFALMLRTAKQQPDPVPVAERLLQVVRQPLVVAGHTVNITASLGVACFPEHGTDAVGLMKRADLAMYHAKQRGRDQHQLFSRNLDEVFISRTLIQKDLGNALAGGELRLVYQPQICLGANAFLRLEALLRWQHPVRGLISPAQFVPVAEETGLINPIGHWVLEQACKQARQFMDSNVPVVMSVNVSARQLRAADFVHRARQVMEITGIDPSQLELEITETTLLDNLDSGAQALRQLQELGVSIALDDFGSGFSSLNYLKNLPVDRLKIDQVFIREIPHDEESKTITTSVVKLAHELHLTVVAEGVETWDQLHFLQSIGCDYVQGFLLFRPLPPEDIGAVFASLGSLRLDGG